MNQTLQPYAFSGDDPLNASDSLGLYLKVCQGSECTGGDQHVGEPGYSGGPPGPGGATYTLEPTRLSRVQEEEQQEQEEVSALRSRPTTDKSDWKRLKRGKSLRRIIVPYFKFRRSISI